MDASVVMGSGTEGGATYRSFLCSTKLPEGLMLGGDCLGGTSPCFTVHEPLLSRSNTVSLKQKEVRLLVKGLHAAWVDSGRPGYGAAGISRSGPMDNLSPLILNVMLKNPLEHPVLEMLYPSPVLGFEEQCHFMLYGADFSPELNEHPLKNGKVYQAKAGDVLAFRKKKHGQYCYLGIHGTTSLSRWLGSCSPDPAISTGLDNWKSVQINPELAIRLPYGVSPMPLPRVIRYIPQFEYSCLEPEAIQALKDEFFSVSPQSNRTGYRLEGPKLRLRSKVELVSTAVTNGTIELLPNGELVVLMADAPTTGGYPRLGYIALSDLHALSQMTPKTPFKLEAISEKAAVDLLLERDRFLQKLQLTLRLHGH